MSVLSEVMFVALLGSCAPPNAPADYMLKIAKTESGLDPYAIHDNTTGRSFHPNSPDQAVSIARDLLAQKHSVDAGLMQINSTNWSWLGLTVEAVFEPCNNMVAGLRVLESFSRYNTGSPTRGFSNGYVERVRSAGKLRNPAPNVAEEAKSVAVPPPPPCAPIWDQWALAKCSNRKNAEEKKEAAPPSSVGLASVEISR